MPTDWSAYEVPEETPKATDWSQYEVSAEEPAAPSSPQQDGLYRAPRKDVVPPEYDILGLNEGIKKPSDIPGIALKGLSVVPKLVETGVDALMARRPLGKSLDQYFRQDPTYDPGEATAEMMSDSPIGQTVVKTGLDIFSDPTIAGSALAKVPAAAKGPMALAASTVKDQPSKVLKTVGKLGEFFTGGRITDKWAKAAEKFTPGEQIFAGKTLDKANKAYMPLKGLAEEAMSGRPTAEAFKEFQPVYRFVGGGTKEGIVKAGEKASQTANPVFAKYDKAVQSFEDAVNKVTRMEGTVPEKLNVLLERAKTIQKRGWTAGPETAELMDAINGLEFTGFGNPRLVRNTFKAPQAIMRGALSDLTKESSALYSGARQKVADAIAMKAPAQGGKMSKYLLHNAPLIGGGALAAGQLAQGDPQGAFKIALATMLLRNPGAWNAATGAARLPAHLLEQGAQGIVNHFTKNPNSLRAVAAAVSLMQRGDAEKSVEGLKAGEPKKMDLIQRVNDPVKSQKLGKYAAPLQQAAQKGPQAVAVTNYVLHQTDPEYQNISRQLNDEEEGEE